MINFLTKTIFLSILISFGLTADTRKWSPSLGKLNWADAKTKCSKQGMRLPTLEELKISYEKNELEPWKKEGNTYWSSKEQSSSRAYYFTLLNGVSFSLAKDKSILVRCIL